MLAYVESEFHPIFDSFNYTDGSDVPASRIVDIDFDIGAFLERGDLKPDQDPIAFWVGLGGQLPNLDLVGWEGDIVGIVKKYIHHHVPLVFSAE